MKDMRDAKVSAKAEMKPKILGYWQSSMDESFGYGITNT